jgi:hypothetical protein
MYSSRLSGPPVSIKHDHLIEEMQARAGGAVVLALFRVKVVLRASIIFVDDRTPFTASDIRELCEWTRTPIIARVSPLMMDKTDG